MLQTIRERLTGWVAAAVIVVIGLALVVSFGNMSTDVTGTNFAAKVDGEEIPMLEFRQVYQNQLLRQQELLRGDFPPALERQLKENVLEGMIQNRVVAQYAARRGYRVSDQQLAQFISSVPAFQVGGVFSRDSYLATLASKGLTPEMFEADQRRQMAIAQLQNGIVASAFYTPAEYRRFIELEKEQRQFSWLQLDPAAFLEQVGVGDDDIEAFYAENSERFMVEESVALEYVELRLDDIASEISVDEAMVRDYYEANAERFSSEEQRHARHILIAVDDETDDEAAAAKARELYAQLQAGADFAELARKNSDDPGSADAGGDLGWAGKGVFVKAFEDALFALQAGEISTPVRSEFGYHIIQLLEIKAGERQPFEVVRDSLMEELRRQLAEDRFYELAERMDDLALENPGSLAPVAEQLGLPLKTLATFTRAGDGPFGYDQALIDTVFSSALLEDGENSPLLQPDEGRAVVLRVTEHRLPRPRPLAEVRDEIKQELRLSKAAELARAAGQALLARLRSGDAPEAVAAEAGVELAGGEFYGRDAELPAELLAAAFRAPAPAPGEVSIDGLPLSDGGFAVFVLQAVQPGRPDSLPRTQRDQRKAQLAQQMGNASLVALVQDLRQAAKVVISPSVFEETESL